MKASQREIVELWQRAQESLRATNTLLATGFPDFAAARAYYATVTVLHGFAQGWALIRPQIVSHRFEETIVLRVSATLEVVRP